MTDTEKTSYSVTVEFNATAATRGILATMETMTRCVILLADPDAMVSSAQALISTDRPGLVTVTAIVHSSQGSDIPGVVSGLAGSSWDGPPGPVIVTSVKERRGQ